MPGFLNRLCAGVFLAALLLQNGFAQKALTWQEVRDKFVSANPSLQAAQIGIDESKAQEITAFLRPNPSVGLLADQINPFPGGPQHSTFGALLSVASVSYLHERDGKRELRHESAQKATEITASGHADLERNLLFSLRGAF